MAEIQQVATNNSTNGNVPPQRVADLETAKNDLRVLLAVLRDDRTQWYVPVLMVLVVLWGAFSG